MEYYAKTVGIAFLANQGHKKNRQERMEGHGQNQCESRVVKYSNDGSKTLIDASMRCNFSDME